MNGVKIAIIVRRLNVKGGTQRQALFSAQELRRRGHVVTLYTFLADPERSYRELFDGLPVVSLGFYPASHNMLVDFWNEFRAARKLTQRIDRDTDILNPHDQVSYRVAYYFKKNIRDIPSVWMMNDIPTKTWGYWREQQCGIAHPVSFLRRWLWRLLDGYDIRTAIRAQDAITVLDNRDHEWVREFFDKDAVVVRSGLDHAQFSYRPRSGLDPQQPLKILAVGIPFPHRRFEDLIASIRLLKERGVDVRCVIAGDYDAAHPYAKKLTFLAAAQGVTDRISFTGRVPDMDFLRLYQESDIFVFPNHLQSWGLAVFEAISCGLPVIVSETAGAAEILENGKTALIVPPKSPEAITEAIIKLRQNPEFYRALSLNARKLVESRLSWPQYTDEMLKIFDAVMQDS